LVQTNKHVNIFYNTIPNCTIGSIFMLLLTLQLATCIKWGVLKSGLRASHGGPNKQKPAPIFVLLN
jgi:hypothetical protein